MRPSNHPACKAGDGIAGDNKGRPHFFALDLKTRKVVHTSDDGPHRAIALARSTGDEATSTASHVT